MGGRTRTLNRPLWRRQLYQLSYAHMVLCRYEKAALSRLREGGFAVCVVAFRLAVALRLLAGVAVRAPEDGHGRIAGRREPVRLADGPQPRHVVHSRR